MKLPAEVINLLSCPVCKSKLKLQGDLFKCINLDCNLAYPVVNDIPVLINEKNSLFSINDFVNSKSTYFPKSYHSRIRKIIKGIIPGIGVNIKARQNLAKFSELALKQSKSPKILVIGASIVGPGMDSLIKNGSMQLIESDISFGPRTMLISDAHDIPFDDCSFDGVIIQAVLEHVIDPYLCVSEIFRVLKNDGLVYAETPFMQQVHGKQFDFTRFTYLGHRRLFRRFQDISSGAVSGPGMALAWSWRFFLTSFTKNEIIKNILLVFAHLTSFYFKYFDYILIRKRAALDAASAYYFMGRKSEEILSDRELIGLYNRKK
ncbi:MAG: methyltransferase domain-containing protein [Candidatus Omnitrophica bacterium]|nr:methyltransferase domain-containing protein [Candidatus Omnitrophota bacterium]